MRKDRKLRIAPAPKNLHMMVLTKELCPLDTIQK